MKMFSYAAASLLALGMLAGCSRSEPDETAPTENAVTEDATPAPEEPRTSEPAPVPEEPAPAVTTNSVAPPPAAEIAPDEQMLDDADATGMTARATRDAPATEAPVANETEEK